MSCPAHIFPLLGSCSSPLCGRNSVPHDSCHRSVPGQRIRCRGVVLQLSVMFMAKDPRAWDMPQPTERPRRLRNDPEVLHEVAFKDQGLEVYKYIFGAHEHLSFS